MVLTIYLGSIITSISSLYGFLVNVKKTAKKEEYDMIKIPPKSLIFNKITLIPIVNTLSTIIFTYTLLLDENKFKSQVYDKIKEKMLTKGILYKKQPRITKCTYQNKQYNPLESNKMEQKVKKLDNVIPNESINSGYPEIDNQKKLTRKK